MKQISLLFIIAILGVAACFFTMTASAATLNRQKQQQQPPKLASPNPQCDEANVNAFNAFNDQWSPLASRLYPRHRQPLRQ